MEMKSKLSCNLYTIKNEVCNTNINFFELAFQKYYIPLKTILLFIKAY